MNATQCLSYGLGTAQGILEEVMADVTPEQAHWTPPGIANPIAALYVHTVTGVDYTIHDMFQGKPPLWVTGDWGKKLGLELPEGMMELEWARSVRIDLPTFREYTSAVYAVANAYITSLTEEDLDRIIPSPIGDDTTLGQLLLAFIIWHIDVHGGEIAALKGIQGAKGYSF